MFITLFGRFKYLLAPYGLSTIEEDYNHTMAETLEGLTGLCRIVDDIIIYDKDMLYMLSNSSSGIKTRIYLLTAINGSFVRVKSTLWVWDST